MVTLSASAQALLALASTAALVQSSPTASTFAAQATLDASAADGPNILPNVQNASAADAQLRCPGYVVTSVRESAAGVDARLALAGAACNVYGTDIEELELRVRYQTADRLAVEIFPAAIPAGQESWYLADDAQTARPSSAAPVGANASAWEFGYTARPFGFKVARRATGDVVFDTTATRLVFENQFVEFKSALPAGSNVYGLGETISDRFRLGVHNRTLYAADIADETDANLYGTHPFYLEQRYREANGSTQGFAHGVYNRNFHGQDILLRDDSITYRILGGSVELYFYAGPTPAEVTKSYVADIGLPALQQYWTLGYHQCRWGYNNVSQLAEVVQTYRDFDIPLETIWSDIDYMDQFRDFTTDPTSYAAGEMAAFLDALHAQDQHYVPIVDAAIYVPDPTNSSDAYDVFAKGNASDVFLKNPDGSLYIGAVWPGFTVFPDWSANGTQDWWTQSYVDWHQQVSFDGIWLDMNEVSSFCTGSCGSGQVALNPVHPPFALPGEKGNEIFTYPEGFANTNASEAAAAASASSSQASYISATSVPTSSAPYLDLPVATGGVRNINYPPYAINNAQTPGYSLAVHAIAPNATHADGTVEYDVHSLWGYLESRATYAALRAVFPQKRPFIISRSSAPGSGAVAGHWGGDNASQFYYMRRSIQQALNFALFGVPMFGVDTCGFNGNSDRELCARWMQLSAFFPFYRNHNTKSANPQEAYVWADVAAASRTAMQIRYSLLPYLYTLMWAAHAEGATVMRALSWEFPDDPALATVDAQFLLGPALMVLPALDAGATNVTGVFPGGAAGTVWYDWYSGAAETRGAAGANVTVDAPLGHIPLYVRGGHVLPLQQPAYTTAASRRNPFELVVALDAHGAAHGRLYLDDGESVAPADTRVLTFAVRNGTLTVQAATTGNRTAAVPPLAAVYVLGAAAGAAAAPRRARVPGGSQVDVVAEDGRVAIRGLEAHTRAGEWAEGGWSLSWA